MSDAMESKSWIGIIFAIVLFGGGLYYTSKDISGDAESDKKIKVSIPSSAPKRLLLVMVEGLRADHVRAYGYPRNTTPFMDSIAKRGLLCENAYTPTPDALGAKASLLTALYPLQHRVLEKGAKLSSEVFTIAEWLQLKGVTTAAFLSQKHAFVDADLDQGFGLCDDGDKGQTYRSTARTIDRAVQWMQKRPHDEASFVFVYLNDPMRRGEQRAERSVESLGYEQRETELSFREYLVQKRHINPKFYASEAEMLKTINDYDASIRYVDQQLKRLYQGATESGFNDDALWVVTSSCGLGLGEHHDYDEHFALYNELVQVPLILHEPRNKDKHGRINRIVNLLDIIPTLADIYNFDLQSQPVTVQGRTLFDLEKKDKQDNWRTFEFFYRQVAVKTPLTDDEAEETIPRIEYDRGYALLLGKWKLICDHRRKRQLFNLLKDPYEQKNILQAHPEEAEEMFDMAKRIADQQQGNVAAKRLSVGSVPEVTDE